MVRIALLFSLTLALALVALDAQAVCPVFPAHYLVGADASYCTHDTIQAAIDAVGTCPVIIDVTREHLYGSGGFCTPNQSGGCHLSISGKNVTLQGWGDGVSCYTLTQSVCPTCAPDSTASLVTLDGANGGGPVLTITGASNVKLRNLTIAHGAASASASGGGVDFAGTGSLATFATLILQNDAGYGGGINFNGSGGSATLTLQANTSISSNTAQVSGGGVRVEGGAHLVVVEPQTVIEDNHAPNGRGGGVEVVGPALADIGSPGFGAGGVIFLNDARYGGGVAVSGRDNHDAQVRLFSTDPATPVRLSQNTATNTGGAVFLEPSSNLSDYGYAILCASGFRMDGNSAQEGAAIYGDTAYNDLNVPWNSIVTLGSLAEMDSPQCNYDAPPPVSGLGAVACTGGACNLIDGNRAQDINDVPKPGSTILVQNTGYVSVDALALRGNSGASALRVFDGGVDVANCLIADGSYGGPLITLEEPGDSSSARLQNCTFANNAIGGSAVIHSGSALTLLDSIIAQPGVTTLDYSGGVNALDAEYLLSNDVSTLPASAGIVQGTPAFVDAANGDYHLDATSLGIDFAPAVAGDDRDLDGLPHDQDLVAVPNQYGVRDLGPYERQFVCAADTVFCNGFDAYQ